jgi:hypothetical protein
MASVKNPESSETFTYRYFLIGDVNPARLTYGSKYPGAAMDAHNPDRERPGEFKRNMRMIHVVRKDELDVEEITREQFDEHCKRVWAKGPRA